MQRKLKECIKLGIRKVFEMGQYLNINILPIHFYSAIPNYRELRKNEYWKKPYSMLGINGANLDEQFDFIMKCCSSELVERQKKSDIYSYSCRQNREAGFGPIEADFLFCFIFSKRPKRIIQIGCGVSTAVIIMAAKEVGYLPEIVCIDPYPTEYLRQLHKNEQIRLVQSKAQHVDLDVLTDLGDNDFLFMDSTHTVTTGSEVNKVILEVLPRLRKGSWIHFHDILFPYDYSRTFLTKDIFFPNETVMLYSYLLDNNRVRLKASLSMLHYKAPERLKAYVPNYYPAKNENGLESSVGHYPSSVYLEVIE